MESPFDEENMRLILMGLPWGTKRVRGRFLVRFVYVNPDTRAGMIASWITERPYRTWETGNGEFRVAAEYEGGTFTLKWVTVRS